MCSLDDAPNRSRRDFLADVEIVLLFSLGCRMRNWTRINLRLPPSSSFDSKNCMGSRTAPCVRNPDHRSSSAVAILEQSSEARRWFGAWVIHHLRTEVFSE